MEEKQERNLRKFEDKCTELYVPIVIVVMMIRVRRRFSSREHFS